MFHVSHQDDPQYDLAGHWMIGRFRYGMERDGVVSVRMSWENGYRQGRVLVPEYVAEAMRDNDVPVEVGEMALENAVSYGVFIAMKTHLPLLLSGDTTAWDTDWGALANELPPTRSKTH